MKKRGKNSKLLIGSISVASVSVLILMSVAPSIYLGLEKDGAGSNNNTVAWDIIVPDDYKNIQDALSNAKEGTRIFVRSGTYRSGLLSKSIYINKKGVVLCGEDSTDTIIDGRYTTVDIAADNVELSGFTLINNGVNGSLLYLNSNNCIISNNTLVVNNEYDGTEYGIKMLYANENTFYNNVISKGDYGIKLMGSGKNIFLNNTITQNNVGISVEKILTLGSELKIVNQQSDDNIFEGNVFESNGYGMSLYPAKRCYILNNTIVDSSYCGISLSNCYEIVLKDNNFIGAGLKISGDDSSYFNHEIENNSVNGKPLYYFKQKSSVTVSDLDAGQIIIASCNNFYLKNSVVSGTSLGLLVAFSDNVHVSNCEFSSNAQGVYIHYSYSCKVSSCNFINNTFDASFQVKGFFYRKSNSWDGNYWDVGVRKRFVLFGARIRPVHGLYHLNTRFKLLDRLGIGRIARDVDRHPAKNPFTI